MNIVVTGGTGFIGSHTCVELLMSDQLSVDNIIVIDNLSNSKMDIIDRIYEITRKKVVFVKADLRDREAMRKVFASYAVDAVIHFAGLKAVGESVQKPLEYYDNNLCGTLVLLETMKEFGVHKLVFSSSATVYGMDSPVPFKEEYKTSATNPYGYTKVVIERMLQDLAAVEKDLAICILRYFNPIGAHESGLLGEDPNDIPNNLLPYVAQVAAGKLDRLVVHGNDYDTPDGTGVRDYIHVVDLAKGHLAALQYLQDHKGLEIINLGSGIGTSVMEIVRSYEKAYGKTIPYEIGERRAGDIATCYASPEKAWRLLGWRAKKTIDEMCADGWRFAKRRYES